MAMLGNTETRWGAVSKALHWTIALLIIGTSIFVLHVNGSTYWFTSGPLIFIEYIHWHKAFGLMALALIIFRFYWRWKQPLPAPESLTEFEQKWSHRTHIGLYVLMAAVPLSGWLSSSFFGSGVNFWGLFTIPPITPKFRAGLGVAYWTHFALSWMMICLVTFHAAAAFYHHFIRKDKVLSAMLPGKREQ
ncbi:cytochrome b [uncultured Parasphingorhabdus sp.]|uniref:cytochrome b n=1 Tax=uncultured Parasphingorhabdus sp. TaxID=2709694 RepID=UPI002AA9508B|nr:cytochrome b [uncultured Parasphingorhabdus sp.]